MADYEFPGIGDGLPTRESYRGMSSVMRYKCVGAVGTGLGSGSLPCSRGDAISFLKAVENGEPVAENLAYIQRVLAEHANGQD